MSKYLDISGLQKLWNKVKSYFISSLSVDNTNLIYSKGGGI